MFGVDLPDRLARSLERVPRHFHITQILAQRLTLAFLVFQAGAEDGPQVFAKTLVGVMLADNDPGKGDDGVRRLVLGVGDGGAENFVELGFLERDSAVLISWLGKVAAVVFELRHLQADQFGVAGLEVAEGARRLRDEGGNAGVPLAADANLPLRRLAG